MRRVIGMDIHRTFGEVVFWEEGKLRHGGRVDMTRTALEGFGKSLLATDEVVIEATGNCMAVSRVLSPFVKRVVIANPLQVKAIAHAHVKTDKIDAGTLASLHAAGYLPEIWTPDAATERMRRLSARRYQVVRHRTRIKNEVHSILHAHLIPKCPHADLFNGRGRAWLMRQPVPNDERVAIERHVRELDRLAEDLAILDREIAESSLDDVAVRRLLTITGVNLTVAVELMAAIGDIARFRSPQKLVSYFGLNPRCVSPASAPPTMGASARSGAAMPAPCLSKRPGRRRKHLAHCMPSSFEFEPGVGISAAVAVARKLAVLVWHMLTKERDYLWARPSLVAHKVRSMELQAGKPQKKGNSRGPTYAYHVKELRHQEMNIARKAQRATSASSAPGARARPKQGRAGASIRQGLNRLPGGASADAPRFATRSPAHMENTTPRSGRLVDLIRRLGQNGQMSGDG